MVANETVLFEGCASHRTRLGAYLASTVVPLGLWIAFVVLWPAMGSGSRVVPALWAAIVPALGGLYALGIWVGLRVTRYRITNRQVEVTTGLLSRKVDSVLLWRVRDVQFRQSLGDRLLGLAEVVLTFEAGEAPPLVLRGLPEARSLYEGLVSAVDEAARARRAAAS